MKRSSLQRAVFGAAMAWLVPSWALADARVVALDGRTWADVVATFESDVASEGGSVALCVQDDAHSSCLPCDAYTLALDENGARAFAIGVCNAGVTTITLVDRDALFDTTHPVARARAITIRALVVSAIEASGGAASTGGSALSCLARVRPYLRDLQRGANVYLAPHDYEVRVRQAGVDVSAFGDGWMLVSQTRIETEVAYDVVERGSGEIVMTGHAALECASDTLTTIDPLVASAAPGSFDGGNVEHVRGPGFGALEIRSGRSGGAVELVGGCTGFYPSEFQHVVQIDAPIDGMRIRVDGGTADLTLAVRTSDGRWFCNDDASVDPNRQDPIVALAHPPVGRIEIWVGAFGAPRDASYRIQVHEGTTTPAYDFGRVRRATGMTRSFVLAGAVTSAFSWCFMVVFDAFPSLVGGDPTQVPTEGWRDLAWIPVVGPWLAEAMGGATDAFGANSAVDAAFQDIGFVSFLLSFLSRQTRPTSIALGSQTEAPRLAFGGGAGSVIGATLAF